MSATSTTHQTVAASLDAAMEGPCSVPFRRALVILKSINDDAERYAETGQWERLDALLAGLVAVRRLNRKDAA